MHGKQFLSFMLAGSLTWLAAAALADTYSPRVGVRHADFTLPAIDDGRPLTLSDFRGKKVLLIQFASW